MYDEGWELILGALVGGRYGHDTHGKMEINMGFRGRAYIKITGTYVSGTRRRKSDVSLRDMWMTFTSSCQTHNTITNTLTCSQTS